MYGTQTSTITCTLVSLFENDVKMYGTQTSSYNPKIKRGFENDVKMYGTQTVLKRQGDRLGLRMM